MTQKIRILLVEDSIDDVLLLKMELNRSKVNYTLKNVDSEKAYIEELSDFKPDLIISDFSLPNFSGDKALKILRETDKNTPFILISGVIVEDRAMDLIKDGATDFLIKSTIGGRISYVIERAMREVKAKKNQIRLEELSRQSQKLEAIGQLTGGIAHDFNNLLAVIMGNLEVIELKTQGQEGIESFISTAQSAVDSGSLLANQLLAFSRRQSLKPELLNLGDVLLTMEDQLAVTLGDAIKLEIADHQELEMVNIDRGQFESAMVNLALNAREAMPKGGQLLVEFTNTNFEDSGLQTETSPNLTAGEYVCVTVSDSGRGIQKEDLKKIFEPFFTTKEVGKGAGLGLSQVYGFIKQSDGHIVAYSDVGRGSTFKLYFPAQASVAKNPALKVSDHAEEEEEEEVSSSKLRILIVDDNAAVLATVVALLESLGHSVVAEIDGKSAMKKLESGAEFDLLFSDIVMPGGMSGIELVSAVRERWPNLKALLTSGFTSLALQQISELPPNVDLINKPYRLDDLDAAIKAVMLS